MYPLKSQGNLLKVGEYQGLFFENSNEKKKDQNFDEFQKFRISRR